MLEKLRLMQPEDISTIVSGEKETLGETLGEEFLQEEINNPFAYFVVTELNHEVIGYIGAYIVAQAAEIINFFVQKDHQHQGYGQRMFDSIVNQCRHQEVKNITLEVKVNNQQAISFYEKNGFKQINIRKSYYDDGSDAIVMQKVIS